MTDPQWSEILAGSSPEVRELAVGAQAVVAEAVPDAQTEVDTGAKLLGFTFRPGTYKGLFAAVAVYDKHVNIMLSGERSWPTATGENCCRAPASALGTSRPRPRISSRTRGSPVS